MPTPEGHEETWVAYLAFASRFDGLAPSIGTAEPVAFNDAMFKAMRDDPTYLAMKDLDDDETKALALLGADPPCDAAGLAADIGCDAPEACTQAWASAAHAHDEAALDRLVQEDIIGRTTPSASLKDVRCTEAGPVATCKAGYIDDGSSDIRTADCTVRWVRTSDGRWIGVDARAGTFSAVASAIE